MVETVTFKLNATQFYSYSTFDCGFGEKIIRNGILEEGSDERRRKEK
jgi:hypothetical protein